MSIIQRGPKSLALVKDAKEAVEIAQGIESRHDRHFGGHRHTIRTKRNPLLLMPLPFGYRRAK